MSGHRQPVCRPWTTSYNRCKCKPSVVVPLCTDAGDVPSLLVVVTSVGHVVQASGTLEELDREVEGMQTAFASVVEYFGEDPGTSTQDFFSTLDKFIQVDIIQWR